MRFKKFLPMLQTLYACVETKPQQIYMILIIVLMFSHDNTFTRAAQQFIIPSVPWFKQRHLTNVSLASLIIIILVRTVFVNLSKLRVIIKTIIEKGKNRINFISF